MPYHFKQNHYTFPEMYAHANEVKKLFPNAKLSYKCGKMEVLLRLKPTDFSISYRVKLIARVGYERVEIFVEDPKITTYINGQKVPHLYSNGSLCLHYPKNHEWSYTDSWAETLIPWTSLWLFYYEIWKDTGEWLGGGVHL